MVCYYNNCAHSRQKHISSCLDHFISTNRSTIYCAICRYSQDMCHEKRCSCVLFIYKMHRRATFRVLKLHWSLVYKGPIINVYQKDRYIIHLVQFFDIHQVIVNVNELLCQCAHKGPMSKQIPVAEDYRGCHSEYRLLSVQIKPSMSY